MGIVAGVGIKYVLDKIRYDPADSNLRNSSIAHVFS